MTPTASILIVDDEPKICHFLDVLLTREGYRVGTCCDPTEALSLAVQDHYDLVITDLKMPGMDGFELVKGIKSARSDLPVIMITGYATIETAVQALRHGVDDYVTKPFNVEELRKVVHRLLRVSASERENRELEERCIAVLEALATSLEEKDPYTQGHSQRVGAYARSLGESAGLSLEEIDQLKTAAQLHDIGKISVSEQIIDKADTLNDNERDVIRRHPSLGERLVGPLRFLAPVRPIIRHHHEAMDGSGYPDGLQGSGIPRLARILSIADAYDAMTSKRPYRDAMSTEQAATEIQSCAGAQFDKDLADTFCTKVIKREFNP